MKLIKRKSDNAVVLLLQDNAVIDFEQPLAFIDGSFYVDVRESTHEVIENCGSPEDTLTDADGNPLTFWGNKFIYTDSWALNPDWVEPEAPAEEVVEEVSPE